MPQIRRQQVLQHLSAACPDEDAERVLLDALHAARVKDKPSFKPEDLARLGEALLRRAQRKLAAAGVGR